MLTSFFFSNSADHDKVKVTNGTCIQVMSDASMCGVSKSHFVSIQLKNLELNYFKGIYIGSKLTGMNHLAMFSGT